MRSLRFATGRLPQQLQHRKAASAGVPGAATIALKGLQRTAGVLPACSLPPRQLPQLMQGVGAQGMLPDSWATWPHLRFLSMGNLTHSIQSTLPTAWGAAGAFPKLRTLYVYWNPGIDGAGCTRQYWSADNSALRAAGCRPSSSTCTSIRPCTRPRAPSRSCLHVPAC